MISIESRTAGDLDKARRERSDFSRTLRVAITGVVTEVNYSAQTVSVQPTIREKIEINGTYQWVELPILINVPFFVYSGGGYCITLPVSPGDECLVIFADSCIDAWWQSGGVQNQVERRRHDLSDGMAIVGFRSQVHTVPGYSGDSVQVRTEDGGTFIDLKPGQVTINADVQINGNVTTSANCTIADTLRVAGINMNTHVHDGVKTGGGSTGGPR
nr:MAG TPA: baseplate component [Caudoviricetes sp.]